MTIDSRAPSRMPLARPRETVLGGVCAALADHLGVTAVRVRVLAVVTALCGGAGILLYLWLWALVPLRAAGDDDPAVRRSAPVAPLLASLGGVAALVALATLDQSDAIVTAALLAVIATSGAAVVWSLTLDRTDPGRSPRYRLGVRGASAIVFLVSGVAALVARPAAVNAVLGVLLVVLGIAVFVAPRVVALWSDLQDSRMQRVREEQRAEIAAHLHDSVLQTLALIQNRSGASSEVSRIARAQERELRDWLFAGNEPVDTDLVTELRTTAAAIELDYAVRIDIVSTGEAGPGVERSAAVVIAAAREGMVNAARHAGGEVSVYIEASSRTIDVFVRDRGPGVSLDDVPADRLGIRESIIGRMTRAGGSATVKPGVAGSGTEVHLHLEVPA